MITCQVCDGGDEHGYMWHGRVVCEHCIELGRQLEQAPPDQVRAVRLMTILTLERMQRRAEVTNRNTLPAPRPSAPDMIEDRGW